MGGPDKTYYQYCVENHSCNVCINRREMGSKVGKCSSCKVSRESNSKPTNWKLDPGKNDDNTFMT